MKKEIWRATHAQRLLVPLAKFLFPPLFLEWLFQESPSWLLSQGRKDEALSALVFYREDKEEARWEV